MSDLQNDRRDDVPRLVAVGRCPAIEDATINYRMFVGCFLTLGLTPAVGENASERASARPAGAPTATREDKRRVVM